MKFKIFITVDADSPTEASDKVADAFSENYADDTKDIIDGKSIVYSEISIK